MNPTGLVGILAPLLHGRRLVGTNPIFGRGFLFVDHVEVDDASPLLSALIGQIGD